MSGENSNRHNVNAKHDVSDGTRRRALTSESVREYAIAQLGFPITDVELSTQQESILLSRVLDEYNKYLPLYKHDIITSVSGRVNSYNLLDLNKPFGREVVDVQIVSQQQFFAPISGVFALGIPTPISHLSPEVYQLSLQYIGMAKKIYSSDMSWEWSEPVLYLYAPNSFGGPFNAAYMYTQDASVMEDVAAADAGWVKDYYLALVKISVGEARGKFGGIPGPSGQTLRGVDLVRDGKEEKAKLEEEILHRSYARTPPLWLNEKG